MFIRNLNFKDFRNYRNLDMKVDEGVNILIGDNAQGKTNILEGIYYCGFLKSHRGSKDRELINFDSERAELKFTLKRKPIDKNINIEIFKNDKKSLNINSIKIRKMSDFIGILKVVMFSPEDLKIIKDSPTFRRRFLDMELCQLYSNYYFNLVQYNKVLKERNALLKLRDVNMQILDIYDMKLCEFGENIIKKRLEYIDKLNIEGKTIHSDISHGKENIEIKYDTNLVNMGIIKDEMKIRLEKNRKRDLDMKSTSIGPHRDDFNILINGKDVKLFGSQGQQRSSILTIKFSSLKIIKNIVDEYPVLLLDDVLSELDIYRKKYVLNSIKGIQTIITCTGIDDVDKFIKDNKSVFTVKNGVVYK